MKKAIPFIALLLTVLFSGCFSKRDDAINAVDSLSLSKSQLGNSSDSTSFVRSSGQATALRLKTLFPSSGVEARVMGLTNDVTDQANARALNSADRSVGAVTQLVLRNLISGPCESADASTTVFGTSNILLPGEKLPAVKELQLAFAAARNVWLYPYKENSPEVARLATLYIDMIKNDASPAEAKKAVCMAAIIAPQFWVGNPGEQDALRKASLELGGRIPKMSDYAKLASGERGIGDFIAWLQDPSNTESHYYEVLRTWHKEWLGLANQASEDLTGSNGTGQAPVVNIPRYRYWTWASFMSTNLNTASYYWQPNKKISGKPTIALDIGKIADKGMYTDVETCNWAAPAEQAFNAETSSFVWELWNPRLAAWEVVARQAKFGNDWTEFKGAVTLANGTQLATGLSAISAPVATGMSATYGLLKTQNALPPPAELHGYQRDDAPAVADAAGFNQYRFTAPSALVGTSAETFYHGALRVRRYARDPSGNEVEQNGFDRVNLWWSGQPVYVCNSLSRYLSSCAYRPPAEYVNPMPQSLVSSDPALNWSPGMANPGLFMLHYETAGSAPSTLAVGKVVDQFRCGTPDLAALGAFKSDFKEADLAQDLLRYPKGSPGNYNRQAMHLHPFFVTSGGSAATKAYWAEIVAYPEMQALSQIAEDLNDEPYRLIEDLIKNGKDYRGLLTSKTSYGRPPLEFYYRTQSYHLPGYPLDLTASGAEALPGSAKYLSYTAAAGGSRPFTFASFGSLPTGWFKGTSQYAGGWGAVSADVTAGTVPAVSPKSHSGILTMPTFMMPMTKVRSLANRYFTRILCAPEPSSIKLSASAAALHESLMFPSPLHIDKKRGCYDCHVQLDPLGKALSRSYTSQSDLYDVADGETTGYWGIQGLSDPIVRGKGAMLGQTVSGVAEVGAVAANSREFAACVVQKAFENLFGRQLGFADAKLFKELTDRFTTDDGYNYNKMIRRITSTDEYLRRN